MTATRRESAAEEQERRTNLTPGLYRATVRGVPDVLIFMDVDGMSHHNPIRPDRKHTTDDEITDARPLILLDPSQFNTGWVCSVLQGEGEPLLRSGCSYVADQIAQQTKPPRIPEPGQGARVDAKSDEAPSTVARTEFMRIRGRGLNWVNLNDGNVCEWHDLIDPVLIREGLS